MLGDTVKKVFAEKSSAEISPAKMSFVRLVGVFISFFKKF